MDETKSKELCVFLTEHKLETCINKSILSVLYCTLILQLSATVMGRQQIVSVNIFTEDLSSTTIFRLKCDEKNWRFLYPKFSWHGECNACCFKRDKKIVWVRKKAREHFRKGNNSS